MAAGRCIFWEAAHPFLYFSTKTAGCLYRRTGGAMKSALAIQCLPLKAGSKEEAYAMVDRAIAVIDGYGLPYQVGSFETTVEGPLDTLLELAGKAHKAMIEGGGSAATYMKLFSGESLGSTEEKTGKYRASGH